MMQHTPQSPDATATPSRRGQWKLLAILMVAFVPIVLATFMYYVGWGVPMGRTNHGELLSPVPDIRVFDLRQQDGSKVAAQFGTDNSHWMLVTRLPDQCDAHCAMVLIQARQIHVALNREQTRLRRAVLTASGAAPIDVPAEEWQQWRGHLPLPGVADDAVQVIIVDPLGNVIMRYDDIASPDAGKGVLKDLQRLLKLSNIG